MCSNVFTFLANQPTLLANASDTIIDYILYNSFESTTHPHNIHQINNNLIQFAVLKNILYALFTTKNNV